MGSIYHLQKLLKDLIRRGSAKDWCVQNVDYRKLWIKHCSDAAQEGVELLVFETAGLILL